MTWQAIYQHLDDEALSTWANPGLLRRAKKALEADEVRLLSLDEEQGRLLDALLKSIEDSFPYASVYYDLAKDEQYEEKTMEIDEVYQSGRSRGIYYSIYSIGYEVFA